MEQNSLSDHSRNVTDITMACNGSLSVSASEDGTFKLWNLQAEKTSFSVRGIVQTVYLGQLSYK
jgi:WD40 repeat protein